MVEQVSVAQLPGTTCRLPLVVAPQRSTMRISRTRFGYGARIFKYPCTCTCVSTCVCVSVCLHVFLVVSENFQILNLCYVLATSKPTPETAGFRLKDFVLELCCNFYALCFAQFLIMRPLTLPHPYGNTTMPPTATDCRTSQPPSRFVHTPSSTTSAHVVGGKR